MEEKYVDENFEIQTRTKDETQIELEKVFLPLLANHGNKIQKNFKNSILETSTGVISGNKIQTKIPGHDFYFFENFGSFIEGDLRKQNPSENFVWILFPEIPLGDIPKILIFENNLNSTEIEVVDYHW